MFQYLTLTWRQDLTTCKQEKLANKRSRVVTKPRNILVCNGCNHTHSDHCGETDDSVHRDVDLENNIRALFLDVIMAQITIFCGCVRALPTLNTERWIEWLPPHLSFPKGGGPQYPGYLRPTADMLAAHAIFGCWWELASPSNKRWRTKEIHKKWVMTSTSIYEWLDWLLIAMSKMNTFMIFFSFHDHTVIGKMSGIKKVYQAKI